MTSVIIIFIVAYIAVLAYMLLQPCLVKVSVAGQKRAKLRWNFSLLTKERVISRIIWSFIGFVALVYCTSLLVPLIWMLYTSFKGPIEYTISTFAFTKMWHLENYSIVFNMLNNITEGTRTYGMAEMLVNSVWYAIVTNLNSIFWTSAIAYVMARFNFIGNKFIYSLGIVIMLVPIVGSGTTGIIFMQKIGLYDKMYVSTLIPPSTPFSGMNFMMIYAAFKAIPHDYSDAARIDGANEYRIMFQIVGPMVLPTMATFFILGFVGSWNAYETFLINYPSTPNLAFGMWRFQSGTGATAGSGGATIPQILAGFVICMIPSSILYLSSQKLIYSKFTVGGLKG